MQALVQNIISGFLAKTAAIRPPMRIKRPRSAMERMKSRMRYRKNRFKIKLWRKRYSQRTKYMHAARKLLRRKMPSFFKSMSKHLKPHKPRKISLHHFFHKTLNVHKPFFRIPRPHAHKQTKFKIYTPKFHIHKPKHTF